MNRRRIAIGVASAGGLAVATAGAVSVFGSGGSANAVDLHAAPAAAVSGSAAATRQSGTAQTDTVVTVAVPAARAPGRAPATAAKTLTMHGAGLFDFGKQVGRVGLTIPAGAVDEVLTPSTVWERRSATAATPTAAATPASRWTSQAPAAIADGDLFTTGTTSPFLVFAMLGGTQPGVRDAGQDVVRGVPVAHYQGTIDLARAAAALTGAATANSATSADAAAEQQALVNAAKAFTTAEVPFDAYLDAQGRLRRFVVTFSYVENTATKSVARVTSATEFYGFGVPVTVVMPTAQHPATTPSAHPSSHTRSHK